MKNLVINIQESKKYLEKIAKENKISNYFIDYATDKNGEDILVLIQEDIDGNTIRNICQIKY